MEIQKTYQKIADASKSLAVKIDSIARFENGLKLMPIGIDGMISYDLLKYAQRKRGFRYYHGLGNTVQASSKTKQVDEAKLYAVIKQSAEKELPVIGLDMRTRTGTLADMLRSIVKGFDVGKVDFKYAVLFDLTDYADIRGSEQELEDEEKSQLRWFEGPQNSPLQFIYGEWQCLKDKLNALKHVPEIKKLI